MTSTGTWAGIEASAAEGPLWVGLAPSARAHRMAGKGRTGALGEAESRSSCGSEYARDRFLSQPLAPIEHGCFGAVSRSHFGRVRLDLMLAFLAPNDQSNAGRGGDTECHRRTAVGFQ